MKEEEAFEQKKRMEEATMLEPIAEENCQSVEKSPALSGRALLASDSDQPVMPKRRVTIVDYYTDVAGDLSTTVGK